MQLINYLLQIMCGGPCAVFTLQDTETVCPTTLLPSRHLSVVQELINTVVTTGLCVCYLAQSA